jgi:hypothetical protein
MIDNFILEYSDFVESSFCEHTMQYFRDMEKAGFAEDRTTLEGFKKHQVDDTNIALHAQYTVNMMNTQSLTSEFLGNFWAKAYPLYAKTFSVLQDIEPHKIFLLKCQKNLVGQAYHNWHFETGSRQNSGRILTFILYLNDVIDGGETEFLYYPKRVKPEQGKLILFPGSFTHTHRGNPPISNEKYVLTGWVEF